MFLELSGLGKWCEHRITESLTELLWELHSVILAEESPNGNYFGINSVIFLCTRVMSDWGVIKVALVLFAQRSLQGSSLWQSGKAGRTGNPGLKLAIKDTC